MKKEDLYPLLGKYLNGFKIVKIENDQFIKGQINLWTDTWEKDLYGDRYLVKFYVRPESSSATIYREVVDEKLKKMEDNWNELKKIVKSQSGLKKKCYNGGLYFEIDELLDKMAELEQGSDNNE